MKLSVLLRNFDLSTWRSADHLSSSGDPRRRGKTQAEDEKLAYELTHSQKELSEHNMLIDLGRNDLGKVSQFGSVNVTRTRKLLFFSNVMHMAQLLKV